MIRAHRRICEPRLAPGFVVDCMAGERFDAVNAPILLAFACTAGGDRVAEFADLPFEHRYGLGIAFAALDAGGEALPIRVMWVLPWPQVLTQSPSTRTVSPTRASASASSSSTVRVSPPALAERLQAVMEIAASSRMKMCFIFMESVFGRAGPGSGDRLPERGFMIQR